MTTLAEKNAHPRDSRITFTEADHTYYIDGESRGYTSTTTVVHHLFPEFNNEEAIGKMKTSRKNPWAQNKFYGKSNEFIIEAWTANKDLASGLGTKMHANIENYLNGLPHSTEGREWELFKAYEADHANLVPFRTEWTLFAEDLGIAGSVDMLYEDPNEPGALILADWKRCKEIKMKNEYQKGIHPLTKHLDDSNYIHYSFQLAIYKKIIEQYYGYKVTQTFIVVLHPNQDKYLKIVTEDVDDLVEKLFEERRQERKVEKLEEGELVEYSERNKENIPPMKKIKSC
jgi:hypothetical protein